MTYAHLNKRALDAAVEAYFATIRSYGPLRPDLYVSTYPQIEESVAASVRAYLGALPADGLIERLRKHADAEATSNVCFMVTPDQLMSAAADRISSLETDLAYSKGSQQ